MTQWGPTEFNDPPGTNDVPWGHEDCGPTSSLMALAALGIASRPGAADAYLAIDHQRDLIYGYDTNVSHGLNLTPVDTKGTVGYGLVQAGADVTILAKDRNALDAALGRGNPVIVGTDTTYDAWGRSQLIAKNYLNGQNPGGHFVTVLGRTDSGNYIIGDPLVKGGPFEVTPDQMDKAIAGCWSSEAMAEVSVPVK